MMNTRFNWKLLFLQAVLLVLVIWIDNTWIDLLFMAYIVWDLLRWAHERHFGTGWADYKDTRIQQ